MTNSTSGHIIITTATAHPTAPHPASLSGPHPCLPIVTYYSEQPVHYHHHRNPSQLVSKPCFAPISHPVEHSFAAIFICALYPRRPPLVRFHSSFVAKPHEAQKREHRPPHFRQKTGVRNCTEKLEPRRIHTVCEPPCPTFPSTSPNWPS